MPHVIVSHNTPPSSVTCQNDRVARYHGSTGWVAAIATTVERAQRRDNDDDIVYLFDDNRVG